MSRHVLMVHSQPKPRRDDEYNSWYNDIHLAEVLAIDGFVSARRFRAEPSIYHEMPSHEYLTLYDIDSDDLQETLDQLRSAAKSMTMSSAYGDGHLLAFTQVGGLGGSDESDARLPSHILFVLTRPLDGREDEFNAWYDNYHLPHVLEVPGFRSVHRFVPQPGLQGEIATHPYLSIYELRTADHEATMDGLREAAKGLREAKSPAAGPDDVHRSYEQIFEMVARRTSAM